MTTNLARGPDDNQRAVHRRYDAYGLQWTDDRGLNWREGTNDLDTDHRFTGQKADGTGLMYYNARYYDPEIGQFISPDSIVPDPTNVFAYNRYMYVYGNPLKYSDPSGHVVCQGTNSCNITSDHEALLQEWEPVQDKISWHDFVVGRDQYIEYALNSSSYYQDWFIRAGLAEGDWDASAARLAYAEGYSVKVWNEVTPFFVDPDLTLDVLYALAESRENNTSGAPFVITVALTPLGTVPSAKRNTGSFSKRGWTYGLDTHRVRPQEGGFHIHIYQNNKEMAKVDGMGRWTNTHGGRSLLRPSELPKVIRREANQLIRWTQSAWGDGTKPWLR